MLSLRDAVRKLSVSTGQSFVKCSCAITAKCSTSRCSCKLAKIACSSKCHGKSTEAKCTNTEQAVEAAKEQEATNKLLAKNKRRPNRKKERNLI